MEQRGERGPDYYQFKESKQLGKEVWFVKGKAGLRKGMRDSSDARSLSRKLNSSHGARVNFQ